MEQAEAVWEGKQIGERQDNDHNIILYKLDGLKRKIVMQDS
jgi:hypothetical protein